MSSHPHIVPTRMNWSLRAEDIKKAATDLIARSKHVMDEVANASETTWEAVMKPLAGASAHSPSSSAFLHHSHSPYY